MQTQCVGGGVVTIDRRLHPRAQVTLRIAYKSAGVLKSDYAENISQGGLFISTEDPFELGQTISLELFCAGTAAALPLAGVVRWCGRQSPGPDAPPVQGIGVEFETLRDPERRAQFEALLQAALAPEPARVDPRERLKILIIEPNHYARELFRDGLRSMAREVFDVDDYMEILEAGDGLVALELAKSTRINLFMVELRTPEVDGAELIRRIRQLVSQSTPIFAMSRPFPGDKTEALSAGADVFLRKPVQLKPLFNTLKLLLKLDKPANQV